MTPAAPVVAVVGRPNVGKSTLVNRILGRREAVVQDVPGVTRDRVAYDALWDGRRFTLVDTGGWEPDARGLQAMVSRAGRAGRRAPPTSCCSSSTAAPARPRPTWSWPGRCAAANRPVVLAVNKVDDERGEPDAAELWSLGLGEPYPVSGLHGRGSGDLLDAVLDALPDAPPERRAERRPAPGGAGRPARTSASPACSTGWPARSASVVDSVAGTTVDPVDIAGRARRRDLAVRRHRRACAGGSASASGTEYYASLRTAAAIEAAEVAVVLLDAGERDQRAGPAGDRRGRRGRPGAGARVQQVGPASTRTAATQLEQGDRPRARAGRVGAAGQRLGARPAAAVDKLADALRTALASWDRRIPTGRLNAWLAEVVARRRRRRAAAERRGCCSRPRPTPGRRGSCCSRPASSRPATGASSSAGCARSSASPARPIEISVRVRERRGSRTGGRR